MSRPAKLFMKHLPSLLFFLATSPTTIAADSEGASRCFGTTDNGRLEGGVQLPYSGDNFSAYGRMPVLAGRTYVHSAVRDVLLAAWQQLYQQHPQRLFRYAETGKASGGPFPPHKTHQNGLSVDFTVPVVDSDGKPALLPTAADNRYGYDIEFDEKGEVVIDGKRYRIDFEALGAHLVALHQNAEVQGIGLRRVLLAPDLQPLLYASSHGDTIRRHITIPDKRSWVRHDDHYHVDFAVPCQPLPKR